ncbi:DUF3871 family protein [Pedobacter lithocola]|uniref:DUF3871 family protein n=1 Tax=Pedobacter lithocola TaxID=1908239 RepID=A0ABV8P765_9SPHI
MEVLTLPTNRSLNGFNEQGISTDKPFIIANTFQTTYHELKQEHLIPVFVKDNQPVISQADFIEMTNEIVSHIYEGEEIMIPNIRVSHPIKGRIPEAKNKPAHLLLEEEKTIYYERMAFVIEVPSISSVINGNRLNLTIGGIKAYNLDNLYSKKGSEEHFKIFIGFQNKVCTNLCISTDGYRGELRVRNTQELMDGILKLLTQYNAQRHIENLDSFQNFILPQREFAHLIGKARMYAFLPKKDKMHLPELQFGDTQLGMVVKDYYNDETFCQNEDGSIDLWRLYNLFTGSNKSSYIDIFLIGV